MEEEGEGEEAKISAPQNVETEELAASKKQMAHRENYRPSGQDTSKDPGGFRKMVLRRRCWAPYAEAGLVFLSHIFSQFTWLLLGFQ